MRVRNLLYLLTPALLFFTCREKYVPQIDSSSTGYLVVEGYINSGAGGTTIRLSRTSKLSSAALIAETKALVRVEGKQNIAGGVVLTETSPGTYFSSLVSLNTADQYRVYIKTAAGKEYASDYSPVRTTPDIDSLNWKRDNLGVQVYANGHDGGSQPGYYRFTYDETWEFHSALTSRLKLVYKNGVLSHAGFRDSVGFANDSSIYRCWHADTPSTILVASTEKLTANRITFPVTLIEPGSWKLGVRYSIQVQMYSISQSNERFLEQMKKNTELLGSIFDAQPSDNQGNVHCLSNAGEVVIGFVEVSQQKQARMFIDSSQLSNWGYTFDCPAGQVVVVNGTGFYSYSLRLQESLVPTQPISMVTNGPSVNDSLFMAAPLCVDCTLRGFNKRPSFW